MRKSKLQIITACALLCGSTLSNAAIVHLSGTTVDFYYDDAQPGMAAYGSLTAVGDSIFATPTNFLAQSTNGGLDSFTAFGTVTVVAKTGYEFSMVAVQQQGDYQVAGAGASVNVVGDLGIEDSSNAATNDSLVMTNTGLGIYDGLLNPWSSYGSFDLSTAMWNGVNSIELSLLSTLTATTTNLGDSALIQNKFVGGGMVTIETSPVPLPASMWLLLSGFVTLGGFMRRRPKL